MIWGTDTVLIFFVKLGEVKKNFSFRWNLRIAPIPKTYLAICVCLCVCIHGFCLWNDGADAWSCLFYFFNCLAGKTRLTYFLVVFW